MATHRELRAEFQRHVKNIDNFVATLPNSDICFLYFEVYNQKEPIPLITKICKLWKTAACNEDVYVARSTGRDGYCYFYRKSEITYRTLTEDDRVIAYERENATRTAPFQLGGATATTTGVQWGNHLTVGLSRSHATQRMLLMTHKTVYESDPNHPNRSQANRVYCNVYLDEPLDSTSQCIAMGRPTGLSVEHTYINIVQEAGLVPMLERIHHMYANGPAHTGGKLEGGRRICTGPKGGKYVMHGLKRCYVRRPRVRGGAGSHGGVLVDDGSEFSTEFVEFVKLYVLTPVLQVQPNIKTAIVVFDVHSNGFMVRYNYGEHDLDESDVFYVDKELAFRAFRFITLSNEQKEEDIADAETRRADESSFDRFQEVLMPTRRRVVGATR